MEPKWQSGGEIVWRPTKDQAEGSRLFAFLKQHRIASFDELWKRSTDDIEWFWNAVLKDLDIRFSTPYDKIVDLSRGDPWARWCVGGRMNIVDSCLDKWLGTPAEDRIALRWEGEEGAVRTLTYGELHREVLRMAAALRRLGIGMGDVVALYMPMTPEIVIALFAIGRIGAIVLPLFSGYGPDAVASRLNSAGAKALFTADGFYRRGQVVAMKEAADQAAAQAPSLERMIVLRRTGTAAPWTSDRDLWWHDLMPQEFMAHELTPHELTSDKAMLPGRSEQDAAMQVMDVEDPLMIIYTSGTTGQPKGALHTHCGFPIKAAQDLVHCFDLKASDTIYWVSDMGWMMGPWMVYGAAVLGATMLLYDGAPDFPGPDRLWSIVERHRVSVLGISPTLVRSLMQHGEEPVRRHNLSSLRVLGSTGEPWNPDPWNWFFNSVGGGHLPIINYSGGTETSGGILGGNLLLPLKPTAFAAAIPGMAADVVDEHGQPVRGEVGELVIRRPWIGMTRGFWKDPERYLETYWARFPGLWTHGDWAAVDSDAMWYILGRSDDTMKVAGKRLGPAEIESILVGDPAVLEAACVGVPDPLKGQEIACICVLRPGVAADDNLREQLRERVAQRMGKPLKPREVYFVRDLPKTRNAKVMRRVVRAALLGEPTGDLSALENPSAIAELRDLRPKNLRPSSTS